jgi:hypothetical protein
LTVPSIIEFMVMCFSSGNQEKIADQERRAERGPGQTQGVFDVPDLLPLPQNLKPCIRVAGVSGIPSLAEGFHVIDSTLAIAEDENEPPAICTGMSLDRCEGRRLLGVRSKPRRLLHKIRTTTPVKVTDIICELPQFCRLLLVVFYVLQA